MTTTGTLAPAAAVPTLSDRAMLVKLSISEWPAKRTDKDATATVSNTYGNKDGTGQYKKNLVPESYTKPIGDLLQEAYKFHLQRTLPWLDSGARIISAAGYLDYTAGIRDFESRLQPLIAALVRDWDTILAEAQAALNGLFKAEDYPAKSQVPNKYGIHLSVMPVPDSSDFRVQLGDAEVARIRRQMDAAAQESIREVRREIAGRVRGVVGRMAERLTAYTVKADGKVENSFKSSLVENIRDLVGFLPSLNVIGDPFLTDLAARMEAELTRYDVKALKDSEDKRRQVAAAAESILTVMDSFVA